MTNVRIDPETRLQEALAEIAFLRNRGLLLAQAITDLKAQLAAERDASAPRRTLVQNIQSRTFPPQS